MEGHRYRGLIERDVTDARAMGARGTPFLIIDGRLVMSGAPDSDEILALLEEAWSSRSRAVRAGDSGGLCLPEDGVCLPEPARP